MKPGIADLLMNAATTLGAEVAPHLAEKPYALGHTGTIGIMLVFLAQEADRAAETLSRDNAEMRALFAAAAGDRLLPEEMQTALARAAAGEGQNLHLSVLEAENAALKAVLIALHAVVDDRIDEAARRLQVDICRHLKASADRRALHLPLA
jgi:dienelactone hydrolase